MRDKDRGLRFEAYRAAIPYRAELIVQVPRYLLDIVHGTNVVLDFSAPEQQRTRPIIPR